MNQDLDEFIEIVTQVRGHLEFQRALGVSVVDTILDEQIVIDRPAAPARPVAPVIKEAPMKPAAKPVEKASLSGLAAVRAQLSDCRNCKLSGSKKNVVFGEGNPEASLMFVGAGPGASEDEQGRPAVDEAGNLLADIIVKGMLLKREDVYITNVVKCRLPENRDPHADEIEACERYLIQQIREIKPRIIVALGNAVTKALLRTSEDIKTIRGQWKKYQGIALMPTFDPGHLLKNPGDKKAVWEDIKRVIAELKKPE